MILFHAKAGHSVDEMPWIDWNKDDLVVLLGHLGAFERADLPAAPGEVGGQIMRVIHLEPSKDAFAVLTDCARLLRRQLAVELDGLEYVQAPEGRRILAAEPAPVDWTIGSDGHINAFRLSAAVASSPLLAPLTRDLTARTLTQERRFALLSAAFAGA